MNMFYTGLGIARSLGERGVKVFGLTSHRGIYGNYSRYAKTVACPDSRNEPEALLAFLLKMGECLGSGGVIFPTRDDDLVFLDRFRGKLERHFRLVVPESSALQACLNKWETHTWARRAGVATPKCWLIQNLADLRKVMEEVSFPCVLKPVEAHHWRQGRNWELVGGRKAILAYTQDELSLEYASVARADQRAIVQEMVPGGDECLIIAACYLDRKSNWVAGFNTQKLVQAPEMFGTGCVVQAASRPELFDGTRRLLQSLGFSGIAEVEYKWDSTQSEYKLIEINPRAWDQHRLGNTCGTELIYLAYCEHAGRPLPAVNPQPSSYKWIAEDALAMTALRMIWKRDPRLRSLLGLARGKRIYAIWSLRDPLPSIIYLFTRFIPQLIAMAARSLWSLVSKRLFYGLHLQKERTAL